MLFNKKQIIMKRFNLVALVLTTTMLLTSCEVIGGIFKAGVWAGIIMVVVIVALLIWLASKFMGGRRN